MKIAFIGDSYSSYLQDGQYKDHWSYRLAQKFPQHQYYNYALGGRGADHHQWCLLDAKKRGVDVVFINRSFNHRVAQLCSDDEFKFIEEVVDDNYSTLILASSSHIWYSIHSNNPVNVTPRHVFEKELSVALGDKSVSITNQDYNDQWFDNVDQLYNFKHIIKLELLPLIDDVANAAHQMQEAHGYELINNYTEKMRMKLLDELGLTVSDTDDHWSPRANMWVLEHFILSQETIDILNNS
tara:strand:- start:492 stop:1211 length:720 start_codon:yes stop_codon:yes gene_type:complete